MIRNEAGNEDLMKEGVLLVPRIEFRCPNSQDLAVLGLNSLGWLFVYLGSDPMYRFDERGRLRRAFVEGNLFRTEGQTLALLERKSGGNSTESSHKSKSLLIRRDLSTDELALFRARMNCDLAKVISGLSSGEITRQHPDDAVGLVQIFNDALKAVLKSDEFLAPAIVRR